MAEAINRNLSALSLSEILSKTSLSGNSLLHVAARSGDEHNTSFLAKNYPFMITTTNSKGDTPLHVAARAQMLKTVNILVQYSADTMLLMDTKNKKGNSALHDALYAISEVSANKVDSAVALARRLVTVDPDACYKKNIADKSPLCLAVESENTEILKYILQALPVDDNCVSKLQGKSPVQVAIEIKHLDMLQMMQDERPNLLLTQDEQGNTPMHWAASVGFLEGVGYLYKINHCSVLQRNKKGNYPFHLACENNHVKVMDMFFDDENDKMPDPTELFNYKGQSILHVAAKKGQVDPVRRILRDKNSDKLINEMDDNGNTPLHLAALKGRHLVAATLISNPHDPRAKWDINNHDGFTAYDIAQQESKKINPELMGREDEEDEKQKNVNNQNENNSESESDLHQTSQERDNEEPIDKKKKKRKPKPDSYKMMMTLSLLVVVRNYYLVFHSKGTVLGNLFKLIGNLHKKSNQSPKRKDVENRITNLIVVAALIAGMAFAASVQIASSSSNSDDNDHSSSKASINVAYDPASTGELTENENKSKKKDGEALIAFTLFNTLAMYTSIMAAIVLCWAQRQDTNLASIDVWFASVMVTAALYNSCVAYIITIYMVSDNSNVFTMIMTVLQGVFLAMVLLLSFQLVIPSSLKKIYIMFNYFNHLQFFLFVNWLWSLVEKTGCYAKYVEGKGKTEK